MSASEPLTPSSVEDALDWLQRRFAPDAGRGLKVAYQFDLSGPGGGSFWARVDDGTLDAAVGSLGPADVVFRLAATDFFAILAGRANADLLFMQERIEVKGDLALALKMRRLFPT